MVLLSFPFVFCAHNCPVGGLFNVYLGLSWSVSVAYTAVLLFHVFTFKMNTSSGTEVTIYIPFTSTFRSSALHVMYLCVL
jgi:hypothetical protein